MGTVVRPYLELCQPTTTGIGLDSSQNIYNVSTDYQSNKLTLKHNGHPAVQSPSLLLRPRQHATRCGILMATPDLTLRLQV